jgi:hypothetical protein
MAAKRKQSAATLELHREPFSTEKHGTYGEHVVSISPAYTGHFLDIELRVGIENRERNIAKGEPIESTLYLPDYEKVDPSTDYARIAIHLEQLERLGNSILQLAAEVKRLGILPATQEG